MTSAVFADSELHQDQPHFIVRREAEAAPKTQPYGVYAYTTKNLGSAYDDDYGYTKHYYSYDIPTYAPSYPTYGASSTISPLTSLGSLGHNGLGLYGLRGLRNLIGLRGLNGISGVQGIGYHNEIGSLKLVWLALYNPILARLLALNLLTY